MPTSKSFLVSPYSGGTPTYGVEAVAKPHKYVELIAFAITRQRFGTLAYYLVDKSNTAAVVVAHRYGTPQIEPLHSDVYKLSGTLYSTRIALHYKPNDTFGEPLVR